MFIWGVSLAFFCIGCASSVGTTEEAAADPTVDNFQDDLGNTIESNSSVGKNATFCVSFNKSVDTSTCTTETLKLVCNNTAVAGVIHTSVDSDDIADNECCFVPNNSLPEGATCVFSASGIADSKAKKISDTTLSVSVTTSTTNDSSDDDGGTTTASTLPLGWRIVESGYTTTCPESPVGPFGPPPLVTVTDTVTSESETQVVTSVFVEGTGSTNVTYTRSGNVLTWENSLGETTINGCTFSAARTKKISVTKTSCQVTVRKTTRTAISGVSCTTNVGNGTPVIGASGVCEEDITTSCTVTN
ncbi:MAG: hypothetical protein HYT76_07340 [Deltaproteobacteria bacterium]|nr:hypothetical protein [Deltaproteobacteria bacterium]